MAYWEALECVLQVEAVIMQQLHDSFLLLVVINRVSHIRHYLGIGNSNTACRICKRELDWQFESGWSIMGLKEA